MSILKNALATVSNEDDVVELASLEEELEITTLNNELSLLQHDTVISAESSTATLVAGIYNITPQEVETITSMDTVSKENVITDGIKKLWEITKKYIAKLWKFLKKMFGFKESINKIDTKTFDKYTKDKDIDESLVKFLREKLIIDEYKTLEIYDFDVPRIKSMYENAYENANDDLKVLMDAVVGSKMVDKIKDEDYYKIMSVVFNLKGKTDTYNQIGALIIEFRDSDDLISLVKQYMYGNSMSEIIISDKGRVKGYKRININKFTVTPIDEKDESMLYTREPVSISELYKANKDTASLVKGKAFELPDYIDDKRDELGNADVMSVINASNIMTGMINGISTDLIKATPALEAILLMRLFIPIK